MYRALGVASRAEPPESALAPAIHGALGHDAARGIARAQEQDVIFAHNTLTYAHCALAAEQQALVEDGAGVQHASAPASAV